MAQEFKNQVAVITGGGSGVGLAVALAFAKNGAQVVILGRDVKKLETAQKQIIALGKCEIFRGDVSKPQELKKVFASIIKKFKRIDILVNCAGMYGPIGKFHTDNLEDWTSAFGINFIGTAAACHCVLPYMLKQKSGKIINLSGGGAVQPFPNFSAYASSKAAVVRFSENLAKEYESQNIQVNAIAPGEINTSVLEQVLKTGEEKVGKEFWKRSLEQKRTGGDKVENAAELVLFLCAKKNKLTGRLVSAKWDKWRAWDASAVRKINKTSEYTLRRIDNKFFKQA